MAVLAVGIKAVLDGVAAQTLRGSGFGARVLLLSPLKDALFTRRSSGPSSRTPWNGGGIGSRVLSGSRLERVPAPAADGDPRSSSADLERGPPTGRAESSPGCL